MFVLSVTIVSFRCYRLLGHNVSEGLCSASFSFFVRFVLKIEAHCIVTCRRRAGCALGECVRACQRWLGLQNNTQYIQKENIPDPVLLQTL